MYSRIKHILDFCISLIAVILLSPVIFVVAVVLCYTNKGSSFFIQTRPGKNEKMFKIIKFKSMNDKRDKQGVLLTNEERLTKIDKFYPRHIDEQLLDELNLSRTTFKIVHFGALGFANGAHTIIEGARHIKNTDDL